MNKIKILCAFLLILTLSACSSGGGGGSKDAVVLFDVPEVLSEASGVSFTESGSVIESESIDDSTLVSDILVALDDLKTETMAGGSLAAPETAPTGLATLNGYVSIPSQSIDSVTDEVIDVAFVGRLTMKVDFDTTTVTATANGFREFDVTDPDSPAAIMGGVSLGLIGGDGTITGTTITTPLNGNLGGGSRGSLLVTSTLTGDVYEEGDTLITYGTVEGTIAPITAPSMTDTFTGGEFSASGDSPSE